MFSLGNEKKISLTSPICPFILSSVDESSMMMVSPILGSKSASWYSCLEFFFRPVALRKAKIVYNFGLSECNRVEVVQE